MKRITSVILAIIMAMSLWVPAFAVEEDSTPRELCETFLLEDYHFDPSFVNQKFNEAIIEGDVFTISGSYIHGNGYALYGGGKVTVIKIAPNAGQDVKITRVEARVFQSGAHYGQMGISSGEKYPAVDRVEHESMIEIRNVNSNELIFEGGLGDCCFDIFKVYYTCEEHRWGEDGQCEVCGALPCNISDHNWGENGRCTYCGALKCDVTGEHTWDDNGHCKYCSELLCSKSGEHNWGENGHCAYCDAIKCTVTGEHTWKEDGNCQYCDAFICTATGKHTWKEDGNCQYCDAFICTTTGQHTWKDDGHCKYCNAFFYDGSDVVTIRTIEDARLVFDKIANGDTFSGKTIVLDADIDYAGDGPYLRNSVFKGTIDGNNHSINNILIPYNLFKTLDGATIKNLKINSIGQLEQGSDTGRFANIVYGKTTLSNVTLSASGNLYRTENNHGSYFGIVKSGADLSFSNCVNDNPVFMSPAASEGTAYNTGGFIGLIEEGAKVRFDNCTNEASITGPKRRSSKWDYNHFVETFKQGSTIGGFVGACYGTVQFYNCTNNGIVEAEYGPVGGLIGLLDDRNGTDSNNRVASCIVNCTNNGEVYDGENTGGLVGLVDNKDWDQSYKISGNKNKGYVHGKGNVGGIIGSIYTDGMDSDYSGNENFGEVYAIGTCAGGIVGASYGGKNYNNSKNHGKVTSDGAEAGGIIGYSEDDDVEIKNSSNEGTIIGKLSTGGLIGKMSNRRNSPKIIASDCSNSGKITSNERFAGGIVGELDTDSREHVFDRSKNSGDVGSNRTAGGIVGANYGGGSFYQCENKAYIGGPEEAGGIIGWVEDDPVSCNESKNSGPVWSNGSAGGIVGYLGGGYIDTLMYSKSDPNYLESCVNSGTVVSLKGDAGGVCGKCEGGTTFVSSSNSGNVNAVRCAGGVCGYLNGGIRISSCSNSGDILSSEADAGGVCGRVDVKLVLNNHKESNAGTITAYKGRADQIIGSFGGAAYTGSIMTSYGPYSIWIVISVAVLAIGGITALVIVKKRKKTALADGASGEDDE